MISLSVLFWMYVILFSLIGATRGWAKEILVTSGVILALFLITIMDNFIPFFHDNVTAESSFWVRMAVLLLMTFFGYQGPNLPRMVETKRFVRDRFEDILLGSFLGGINGYMFFGTAWYFLIQANYPFNWISPPDQLTEAGRNAIGLIEILPPQWLQSPLIYIAVGLAFVFILVVFI